MIRLLLENDETDPGRTQKDPAKNALYVACRSGDIDIVRHLLSHKRVRLSPRRTPWYSPFECALCGGHEKIADVLRRYDAGHAVTERSLRLAAHPNRALILQLSLDRLQDDDAHKYHSMVRNLLRWAAEFGRTSAVKVLLLDRPGISPNPRPGNDTSRTALYLATVNGHYAIVRLLLKRSGIRPNLKYQGQTALHAAIFYGYKYIAQLLLEHKAVDRNAKDGYHRTPLSAAIWRGRAKIACLILQQPGIDITWIGCQGRTAASYAAQRGYLGILRALYKRDDTVLDNVDKHSRTLLIWTARNGYAQTVRFILEHRRSVFNRQDKFGYTGLIMAVRKGRLAVVRVLLEFGADVRLRDKDGRTALWFARESKYRNRDIEKILVETMESNPE